MQEYTVADYLIDRLKELGLEHLFGVPGDFSFPLLDRIEARGDLEWRGCCNELNAGYAADGYARSRQGIGAYSVTAVVGDLSAACALAGAYSEYVPVVAISGQPEARPVVKTTHHSINGDYARFPRMMQEITVDHAVLSADHACAEIDRLLSTCWSERLPVWMGLPRDVAKLPVDPPSLELDLTRPPSDPEQLKELVEAAVALLDGARSPAALVEFPVGRFGFTDAVQDFAVAAGIPFACTFFAKSAFIDMAHPNFVGMYFPDAGEEGATRAVQQADVLITLCLVESEMADKYAAVDGGWDTRIDLQPRSARVGDRTFTDVHLPDVLGALRERLTPRTIAFDSAAAVTERPAFEPSPGAASISHDRLFQAVLGFVGEGDTLCVEQATINFILNATLPARARFVDSVYFEPIGYATPAMFGSLTGNPRSRHLLLTGDGAFQVTAQELSSALRNGLAPIVVLLHNDVYAYENYTEPGGYRVMAYNDLPRWSYAPLMAVFDAGGDAVGVTVTTEAELAAALSDAAAAHARGRATLIEVMISGTEFPTWTGVDQQAFITGLQAGQK